MSRFFYIGQPLYFLFSPHGREGLQVFFTSLRFFLAGTGQLRASTQRSER